MGARGTSEDEGSNDNGGNRRSLAGRKLSMALDVWRQIIQVQDNFLLRGLLTFLHCVAD